MMQLRRIKNCFQVTRSSGTIDFNRQQGVPDLILCGGDMCKPEEPEVIFSSMTITGQNC